MLSYEHLWQIQEPIIALSGFAEVWLHATPRIRRWREATFNTWYRLQLISWPQRSEISAAFIRRFHSIFGDRLISWRRLIAGSLYSIITVIMVNLAITYISEIFLGPSFQLIKFEAWSKTIVGAIGLPQGIYPSFSLYSFACVVYDGIGWNIIPDLISLTETCWIIQRASDPKSSLFGLALVDFLLTTMIWFFWHYAGLAILADGFPSNYQWFSFYRIGGFGGPGLGLGWVYVITTYSTSFLWIFFVAITMGVATLRKVSPLFVRILESRPAQELPILSFIGAICIASWPILFILRVFLAP